MDRPGQSPIRRDYDKMSACNASASDELPADTWSHIKVKLSSSQMSKGEFDGSDGSVGLFVNGKLICENGAYKGRVPGKSNVAVYLGDPWHNSAVAEIKDMQYGKSSSNWLVGLVESVRGITGLTLLVPLGYLADRVQRIKLIRVDVLVGALSAAILIFALVGPPQSELGITLAGVIVFAGYQQCISGAMTALLGDSVLPGRRYKATTHYKTTSALGMAAAPATQLLLLLPGSTQNVWTRGTTAILIGFGWLLLPFIMLFAGMFKQTSRVGASDELERPSGTDANLRSQRAISSTWLDAPICGTTRRTLIPFCCESFLLLTLLGNGMTVRFLPLYFTQVRHFTPIQLCLLTGGCRVVIAFCVQLIRPLASITGRANLVVILHVLSAGFLWAMSTAQSPWLASLFYTIRFVTLHARDPILTSIVLDTVHPDRRGFWAQFSSLRTFSFSGSALIGGWLADRYGYEYSFYVTTWSLLAAVPVFVPVMLLFPRSEVSKGLGPGDASPVLLDQVSASGVSENQDVTPACPCQTSLQPLSTENNDKSGR